MLGYLDEMFIYEVLMYLLGAFPKFIYPEPYKNNNITNHNINTKIVCWILPKSCISYGLPINPESLIGSWHLEDIEDVVFFACHFIFSHAS